METLTITRVTIQLDVPLSSGNIVADAHAAIGFINKVLQDANLECQPQIFLDSIHTDLTITKTCIDLRDK